MNKFKLSLILPLFVFPGFACLWDYDTIQMERQQFPSTLELITGGFVRHSPAYYEWRIKNRLDRMKSEPSPNLYDDIAVAYDKLGQHNKAIETMEEKEKRFPGLYETQANLGTFHIHSGALAKGAKHIEKAIEINPDAHFGREVYQLHLVNYLLKRRESENKRGLGRAEPFDYVYYVLKEEGIGIDSDRRHEELEKSLKGILGMMRFGNHDSPILLEVLANHLVSFRGRENANRIAARAYLKASYETGDEAESERYRAQAESCLALQTAGPLSRESVRLADLEADFKQELEQANEWYQRLVEDEKRWIKNGVDVDRAFSEKYYEDPTVVSNTYITPLHVYTRKPVVWLVAMSFIVVAIYVLQKRFKG